jgi:hypothetical protein
MGQSSTIHHVTSDLAADIAAQHPEHFERPAEVAATLMGLYDDHERVDATMDLRISIGQDLCPSCRPLLLERVDRADQPFCWVHSIECEVAQDPEALDAWSQQITTWMAHQRGKPIRMVGGEITARSVLARLSIDDL